MPGRGGAEEEFRIVKITITNLSEKICVIRDNSTKAASKIIFFKYCDYYKKMRKQFKMKNNVKCIFFKCT